MCGEKLLPASIIPPHVGSPPRVRGKVSIHHLPENQRRITPACAGKSVACGLNCIFIKDHPRVCGEKQCSSVCKGSHLGSPPRVRGKARNAIWRAVSGGITPACAGKSCFPPRFSIARKDHPRVCGEKMPHRQTRSRRIGSPPRVRGKVIYWEKVRAAGRITPACAGKSKTQVSNGLG